jgi:hypothetical protein
MSGIDKCFVDEDQKKFYRDTLLGWKEGDGMRWLKESE